MLSKILKSASMPASVLLVLLVSGIVLSRLKRGPKTRRYRTGRILLIVTAALWYVLSLSPVANYLIYPLESAYRVPPAEALHGIEAVVVLSGGLNDANTLRPQAYPGAAAVERLTGAVRLFKRCGAKRLYITGGWGNDRGRPSEASVLKILAMELGVPGDRIELEEKAENTFQHAGALWDQSPELQQARFALVTSALHMPRAVQSFRMRFAPEQVVPYPSGWLYSPPTWSVRSLIPDVGALSKSTVACVEYLGRVWYWMRPSPTVTAQPIADGRCVVCFFSSFGLLASARQQEESLCR